MNHVKRHAAKVERESRPHTFTLLQVSDYDDEDRQYKVTAISYTNCSVMVGDTICLAAIGNIVANGHRVIIEPKGKS